MTYAPKKNRKHRLKNQKPFPDAQAAKAWRVIDGAIRDAFKMHPEYLTEAGRRYQTARRSILKRVYGAVILDLGGKTPKG